MIGVGVVLDMCTVIASNVAAYDNKEQVCDRELGQEWGQDSYLGWKYYLRVWGITDHKSFASLIFLEQPISQAKLHFETQDP